METDRHILVDQLKAKMNWQQVGFKMKDRHVQSFESLYSIADRGLEVGGTR